MKTDCQQRLGQGLLSHLHLTASQAAVVLDARSSPETLLVYVYDQEATGRRYAIKEWRGHPVEVHKVSIALH